MEDNRKIKPTTVLSSTVMFAVGYWTIFKSGITQSNDIGSVFIIICGWIVMFITTTVFTMFLYMAFKSVYTEYLKYFKKEI